MLNKSIKFLIHHKLIAVILCIMAIGWGLHHAPFQWQVPGLPTNPVAVDAIPDIGENQQIVYTQWEGRSPQDIEDQITYPLTTSLLGIPGVKTIRSNSMLGVSSIYIIFEEDVEFYWSRSRIIEKLNSLPKNLLPEGVSPSLGPDATGLGQVFWYTLEGRDKNGNVTGGWDLQELRSLQDYYVKYGLSSAHGVSEVASIGGHVKEYQINVNPQKMQEYNLQLDQLVQAVKETNRDIGAQTLEINRAEYLIRGLGDVTSRKDIEHTVVSATDFTAIRIKDVADVQLGPKTRRGILDKEGAEVVGGVVVARYGANPMEVITNVKDKLKQLNQGLPSKTLADGTTSQVTIVPFYDRSTLIQETLGTLNEALGLEILITILVIMFMVNNLKASGLISGLLPIAVLLVFVAMKWFDVTANIVALSGIAIAIGTMVDMGVILSENILRHLEKKSTASINTVVYQATSEVSGAIVTAVLTTIVSFIPVFTLSGAEGKLFWPLAFTKTMALLTALLVSLFLIPPFAAMLFKKRKIHQQSKLAVYIALSLLGIFGIVYGIALGWVVLVFSFMGLAKTKNLLSKKWSIRLQVSFSLLVITVLLARIWQPLGVANGFLLNFLLITAFLGFILGGFSLFKHYYLQLLHWALNNKLLFLSLPLSLIIAGVVIMQNTGKEFMPALDEGTFLLMPTALPHAGIEENKRILQQLDMAVASIPEVETVVGKAGRTESALDPAPLSMFENIIQYKPEYMLNEKGKRQRYKVTEEGYFILTDSSLVFNENLTPSSNKIPASVKKSTTHQLTASQLIPDEDGEFYRNWRPSINTPDDIWNAVVKATQLPGITSAPKLQPIETRLVMLQSGMRAPMGIKIQGPDLASIEQAGLRLEKELKQVNGVNTDAVFAERIVGKPYLLIDIQRDQLAQYGIRIESVQQTLEVALGGKTLGQTVEGRERYGIRVRYPRELRDHPQDLKSILIPIANGQSIPLSNVANIRYEKGPQMIKSENTFLVSYVLFDKKEGFAETTVVENAQQHLDQQVENGSLQLPEGVQYEFTGNYKNQVHAEKTLAIVVPLSLVIIFLILYLQFKSVSTAFMVFSGVAVAFAGGFIMIWLYGQDWFFNVSLFGENFRELFSMKPVFLSVAVWVGFIALFGIATDDGVVMATYLTQSMKKNRPKTKTEVQQAVIEAGRKRIRPCLMTSATTLLALLPVLTASGRGSDIMIPMAIPTFGGMLVALISLFVVPVLFSWKNERNLKP